MVAEARMMHWASSSLSSLIQAGRLCFTMLHELITASGTTVSRVLIVWYVHYVYPLCPKYIAHKLFLDTMNKKKRKKENLIVRWTEILTFKTVNTFFWTHVFNIDIIFMLPYTITYSSISWNRFYSIYVHCPFIFTPTDSCWHWINYVYGHYLKQG